MTTTLITGANRGIGLEHVRQALAANEAVIAACRAPAEATELQRCLSQHGPSKLRLEALDVSSGPSIKAMAARLQGVAIDVLINNAGLYGSATAPSWPDGAGVQSLPGMEYDLWEKTIRVNTMGPFQVTASLLQSVLASQRRLVVMMSSELGSITQNTQGTSHAYRSSKAALNMLAHGLAIDLKPQGVTVIALAPGWTKTDLGGDGATLTVEASVKAQRQVLATLSVTDSGQFFNYTGEILPW